MGSSITNLAIKKRPTNPNTLNSRTVSFPKSGSRLLGPLHAEIWRSYWPAQFSHVSETPQGAGSFKAHHSNTNSKHRRKHKPNNSNSRNMPEKTQFSLMFIPCCHQVIMVQRVGSYGLVQAISMESQLFRSTSKWLMMTYGNMPFHLWSAGTWLPIHASLALQHGMPGP